MENDDQAKIECFWYKRYMHFVCFDFEMPNDVITYMTSKKGVLKAICVTCEASINALRCINQRLLANKTTLSIQPHSAVATVPLSEPNDISNL